MSNIGEAQITRLTRERLAAIKKFLPVRDSFRNNLQAQQQARMGFTTDTQRLFAPITTAIEKSTPEIVTAIEKSKPEVAPVVKPVKTITTKNQQLRERFNDNFLTFIDNADDNELTDFIISKYSERYTYLTPGSSKAIISNPDKWLDVVYKLKLN